MPNFRFGQPVHGNVYHRGTRGRNATTKRRTTASCGPVTPTSPTSTPYQGLGGSGGYDISRFNPAYDRLEEGSVIEDWIPRDLPGINKMLRIIYNRDAIAGPAVDIMAQLPWSEFDLHGIEDKGILEFYEGASQLFGDKAQDMPAITTEFLVLGRFCASLLYDEDKGYWTDFVPHDSDFLTITPIPIRGFDPKIDLVLSPGIRQFLQSQDYRDQVAVKQLPPELLQSLRGGGAIPLDPLATLYVRRKSSPYDHVGTSIYCVSGDTLVSTTQGLVRIADLHLPTDTPVEVEKKIGVGTLDGATETTSHWVYSGVSETIELTTDYGYQVRGTPVHPVLTLDPVTLDTRWKPLRDIGIGDLVATDLRSQVWPDQARRLDDVLTATPAPSSRAVHHELPRVMSDELAIVLGYMVSEGHVGRRIEFGNMDPEVADDFETNFRRVFPTATLTRKIATNGMTVLCCYAVHVLGFMRTLLGGVTTKDKSIPPAILESTREHAASFLAAMFEGDGTAGKNVVSYYSSNLRLLRELQVLLTKFGIASVLRHPDRSGSYGRCSRLSLQGIYRDLFLDEVGFRSVRKSRFTNRHSRCIVAELDTYEFVRATLERRRQSNNGHYSDDDGNEVQTDIWSDNEQRQKVLPQNSETFAKFAHVSQEAADKIITLERQGYFWQAVAGLKRCEPEPVYDLCVPRTEAFVANGLVVHNTRIIPYWALEKALMNASVTAARRRAGNILHVQAGIEDKWEPSPQEMDDIAGLFIQADEDPVGAVVATRTGVEASEIRQGGDIWKWSEEWQTFAEGKMRGLGISEALLSGDATYNNMEQARSVFTEQIIQLRQYLTNQVYYRRFKTLARAHGFRKTSKANLDHRVRIRKSGGLNNLSHEEAMEIPEDDLIVPTMQWRKSLLPEGDREYLELLEMLKEQGVPIPLKVWAARGGYDIHEAMDMLDDDIKMRKQIDAWKKATGGGDEEEGGAWGETEGSPFWDRSQQFLQLSRGEARACLKHLVGAANEHAELLGDSDEVMRVLHGQLGNRRKVELMAYLLMRLQLTASIPISHETAEDIATHLLLHETLSERRRHQELTAFAQITGRRTPNVTAAPTSPDVLTAEVKEEVDRAKSSEFLDPTAPTLLSGAA